MILDVERCLRQEQQEEGQQGVPERATEDLKRKQQPKKEGAGHLSMSSGCRDKLHLGWFWGATAAIPLRQLQRAPTLITLGAPSGLGLGWEKSNLMPATARIPRKNCRHE